MRTLSVHIFCLLLALALLGGCSTVQVLETWHSSSPTASNKHKKLLIVSLNLDKYIREMYENIVVNEMLDSSIPAVAGHEYVTLKENYNREDIKTAVKNSGCDGVLTTKPLSTGNQQIHQQGQGSVLYGEGFIPSSWDMMIATLQVSLYTTETGQLVWTATVKATDDDNKYIESRDMGELLIKLLRRDGMI